MLKLCLLEIVRAMEKMPVYGKTQIILSEKAFIGIVLSSIEVYKK
jgi:hypothetical protein